MFKKHGDGKIISVVTSDEELDEQQKKAFKEAREIIIVRDSDGRGVDSYPVETVKNTKKLES